MLSGLPESARHPSAGEAFSFIVAEMHWLIGAEVLIWVWWVKIRLVRVVV